MLIFGYGPIPALGLKGAAYATAISRGMTMILSLAVLFYREKLITLTIPSRQVFIGCWKAILYIGIPSGLSRMVIPLVSGIMTSILSTFGESAVAAFGVGTRVEFLATSILIALSASIGPFVGQNFGAGRFDRIRKALNYSYIFSLIWGFGIAIVLFMFSKQVSSLFTSDPDIINYTSLYLSILPISYGFYGIVQIVNSNLNTLNSPIHASLIIAFQMFVIAIPSIYIGKYFFGISGVFAGWMLGYVVGGIISFVVNKWKYKKIEAAFK
jgi:Na+-driven multidrug efflux pump